MPANKPTKKRTESKKKAKQTENLNVSDKFLFCALDLSQIFGVNQNTIRNYPIQEIKKVGQKKFFDIREFYKILSERGENKRSQTGELTNNRARRELAMAIKAEMEIAEMEGNLIPVELVILKFAELSGIVFSKLEGLDSILPQMLTGRTDRVEIQELWKAERTKIAETMNIDIVEELKKYGNDDSLD